MLTLCVQFNQGQRRHRNNGTAIGDTWWLLTCVKFWNDEGWSCSKIIVLLWLWKKLNLKCLSKQQCFDCRRKHCLYVRLKASSYNLRKLSTRPLAAKLFQTSSCKVMSKTRLQFALHAWIVVRHELQSQSWLWHLFAINYHTYTYWLGPYLRKRFNHSTLLWI